MTDLYHHGVKGQKWGVRRKLKSAGDRVSTSLRNTSNQISHPVKYAKAATREIKGHGYMQTAQNHASRKRLVADVKNQIDTKRSNSRARGKSILKKMSNILDKTSKVAAGMETDRVEMDLHLRYPDLYKNPLSKYK